MSDSLHVRTETRKVYVGGGRGWLTKRSAYRAEAKSLYLHRYRCECEPEIGFNCGDHTEEAKVHYLRIRDRLARFLKFVDSRRAA